MPPEKDCPVPNHLRLFASVGDGAGETKRFLRVLAAGLGAAEDRGMHEKVSKGQLR